MEYKLLSPQGPSSDHSIEPDDTQLQHLLEPINSSMFLSVCEIHSIVFKFRPTHMLGPHPFSAVHNY
jgi:hypothetical protein